MFVRMLLKVKLVSLGNRQLSRDLITEASRVALSVQQDTGRSQASVYRLEGAVVACYKSA